MNFSFLVRKCSLMGGMGRGFSFLDSYSKRRLLSPWVCVANATISSSATAYSRKANIFEKEGLGS